jgi:hypothetical protein
VQQRWEVWPKEIHIEYWVQAKERRNIDLKTIFSHSLGDGVRCIMDWEKLMMGPCKELFFQV